MNNTESTEMYLETILLLEKEHGHAHGVDIAKQLGISKPSVSKAMRFLQEKELITKESYGYINLSKKGRKQAEKIYCKHQEITQFLEDALSLSYNDAIFNACKMEHFVSDTMIEAIKKYNRSDKWHYQKVKKIWHIVSKKLRK